VTNHIVHAADVALDHLARYEHHTIDDESTATVASGTSGHRLANCSRLHWRQHKLIGSSLHTKTRRLSLARFVDPACHRMSLRKPDIFFSPMHLFHRMSEPHSPIPKLSQAKCAFQIIWDSKKRKGRPYSITEHRVPELILVLGSQPAGDVSHKPGAAITFRQARSYPRNP